MRKLLLTQSQVAVAITTIIVTTCTFFLFLAGYELQQHTVRDIHQTIRPRIPDAPAGQVEASFEVLPSRLFGDSAGRIAHQKYLRAEHAAGSVNWQKLAHVQLVHSHHDVCNAIMIFGNLASMKSPARRILLFPQAWALEKAETPGDSGDPWLETSIRLMRLAARRYDVELRAILPTLERTEQRSALYSLSSLVKLTDLDRVMNIELPGVILDASRFDAMLAFTESVPFAVLQDTTEDDGVHADDVFLIEPDQDRYQDLHQRIQETPGYNDSMFVGMFKDPLLLSAQNQGNVMVRSVGELHSIENDREDFNQTEFLVNAAYMRFSDTKLPGPEWDVPYEQRREARPMNPDADWLWTELYGQFAQKRSEICGLDLEPWRAL
ncbi:hypothetical protein AMS68_006636 [Peltaster fructicola]|uniref:Glycosyltransferase family 8 protein n=1 Tax=Peltaster fructicola TaxID=286661 RepID=A0A6H0Y2P3_9PEZI|nr:hypothetical protein AMS68_006636 [Peltaster fructicola]